MTKRRDLIDTSKQVNQMKKKTRAPYFLESERLYFREIRLTDVNEKYCRWMNDPDVIAYLESRFYPNTPESLKNYVSGRINDPNSVFWAIVVKKGEQHIGNIKIGPINWIHRLADVGVIIGERAFWGKGYGTEAIKLASRYAFTILNLNKLTAGMYSCNISSLSAFKKANFTEEGIRKNNRFFNGKYVDEILLGITSSDYISRNDLMLEELL